VTVGKERHRFCDPLFDPLLLLSLPGVGVDRVTRDTVPLQEAARLSVATIDLDKRAYVWDGLLVTGDLTSVRSAPL
jgi:actin-related protein 9